MNYEQPQAIQPERESDRQIAPKVENPWVETGKTIVFSIFLALGIQNFVARSYYIPTGSMLPTLQINDRLIVDKVSYRFTDPVRGDIVVFNPPDKLGSKDAYIKRLIGLPGDRVEVKDGGTVYINGIAISEKYVSDRATYTWTKTESSDPNFTPNLIVPKDQYLVLGDNRNNSLDSHYWGFVPKDHLIGKAVVRLWPIDRAGGIDPQPDYK
jgi:signal peptidase I